MRLLSIIESPSCPEHIEGNARVERAAACGISLSRAKSSVVKNLEEQLKTKIAPLSERPSFIQKERQRETEREREREREKKKG